MALHSAIRVGVVARSGGRAAKRVVRGVFGGVFGPSGPTPGAERDRRAAEGRKQT
jgi:hypothetical protein